MRLGRGRGGLEPTYEGVKHGLVVALHVLQCGLEPTYEGLKREEPT